MSKKYDLLSSATAPITLRVIPELAEEVGLNASLLLLQLAYWIRIADNEHDGNYWTFQSLRGMKRNAFPFWSVMTIDRTIQQLVKLNLIVTRNDLNKRKGDNTRWFALNPEGIARLHSISLHTLTEKRPARVSQIDTPLSQIDTRVSQIETTLPEITPEISTKSDEYAPLPIPQPDGGALAYTLIEAYADAWDVVVEKYRRSLHTAHRKAAGQLADLGAKPDEVRAMIADKRAQGRHMDEYPLVFAARDYVAWKSKAANGSAPVDEKTAWRAAQKARPNVAYDAALDMLLPAFSDEDDRRRYITDYLKLAYVPTAEEELP